MIRIGTFSRISQVPVSTLRYYDEVGLLPAAAVDEFTGYRSYSLEQLPRLRRILALKEMGLPLEEIRLLLQQELPVADMRRMLNERQAELRRHLAQQEQQLARLDAWLDQLELEENMPDYDVLIKKIEPQAVLSLRDTIKAYSEQGRLWDELGAYIASGHITCSSLAASIYHSDEPEIDVEVAMGLAKGARIAALPGEGRVQVRELPGIERAATVIYSGPLENIGEGYRALLDWVERQGQCVGGPMREVYLRGPEAHQQNDPGVVVEIQAPL